MALLLDTNILVWLGTGDARLSSLARSAIEDGRVELYTSAASAFEFVELNARGRFGAILDLDGILNRFVIGILPLPADLWRLSSLLPDIHRDPVDRMLIAHAIHADLTLITSDDAMRSYPVKSIW